MSQETWPQLIALSGPSKASIFPLGSGEVLIGRDPSNQILLEDISVSRRHCLISVEGGGHKLSDLQSHNGTFVNEVPVKERLLEHADRIKVGNTFFLFLLRPPDDGPDSGAVSIEDDDYFNTETAVRFRVEDALYPMARDLSALLKVSTAINSLRSPNAIQRELLEQIFAAIPAERAAVLFVGDGEVFTTSLGMERDAASAGVVSVSRTVVQHVLRERVALLDNDAAASDGLGGAESLLSANVRAVLCAPLITLDKTLGVIYLDTRDPAARFDRTHLRLLTAIANVAAGVLENARHMEWLEGENRRLRADHDIEHNMIGESPAMREVYQFISKVAAADSTVLITGESGTGKELAARALHQNGPRSRKAFVAVNCATLSETLLESELFGYEKGAFTGAFAQRKGKIEEADGGTLFLDEVGELAPPLQAKLLRVLQEREFTRVGGTRPVRVDIRVLAATNKDLRERSGQSGFREDLFFRLNVISLKMPPLRSRREDIPLLASYFVAKYAERCKRKVSSVSPKARSHLVGYDWPGNVRELENAVERAVVLGSSDQVLAEDLPETVLEAGAVSGFNVAGYHESVNEAKRQIVLRAMGQAQGSYQEAARILGLHPNNLHRLIKSLGVKIEPKK